jgi:hypothetical protein
MAYKKTSHLSATPVVNGYTALYTPPFVPNYTATTEFTLTQKYHKRPDLLAYDLYGEAAYWWVFALYNKNEILDPINDFVTGLTILLPNRNFIAGI